MKISSKEKIKMSFITLLETNGLENITITDITRTAKINRGTFYLAYADKYELLYTLENEIIDAVLVKLKQAIETTQVAKIEDVNKRLCSYEIITREVLAIIYEERKLIRALMGDKGDQSFVSQFKKEVFRLIFSDDFLNKNKQHYFSRMPTDYLEEVILSGLSTVIIHWLSKDCLESIDTIAQIINYTNFAGPITLDYTANDFII